MAEQLYPVSEVAELWRCSPAHVYNLIARNELRTVNLSGSRAKTRVPESALREYIERNQSLASNQGARA